MGRIWSQVSAQTRKRLAWCGAGAVFVPWAVGEVAKTFYQPGLVDDAARAVLMIDILVAAVAIFLLTVVFTVSIGCAVTAVMKGPRYDGDPFPADRP